MNPADSFPLIGNDESPDDVCGLAELAEHLTLRTRMDTRAMPCVDQSYSRSRTPLGFSATFPLCAALSRSGRNGDLIDVLGRLTC